VPDRLKSTWLAVLLATLAVVGSGGFIVRSFVRHVFLECRGRLDAVPTSELRGRPELSASPELEIRYDEVAAPPSYNSYKYPDLRVAKNVRVVWKRSDAPWACADVPVDAEREPGAVASELRIYRDDAAALFLVQHPHEATERGPRAAFRKVDDRGHRLQRDRILEPQNLPLLVLLLSIGALGVAAFRALRATPYATRMFAWRSATLRDDRLVEGENGAVLGIEPTAQVPAGAVIVDPAAFEGRDVYREMPVLTRRTLGAGSHEQWHEGTMRRLRDARSLAIVSTATTIVALVARLLAAS
jgi:hypothetical protein